MTSRNDDGWSGDDERSPSLPTEEVFQTAYDPGDDRSLNSAIIDAVAAVRGESPTELPPLHESVDTDALDGLFDHSADASMTVRFHFAGVTVEIAGGHDIVIYSPGETADRE